MISETAADFASRLQRAVSRASTMLVELRPGLSAMPLPIARYDDPFLPFSKAVISTCAPHACGFVFDLAAYMTHGAAGMVALERAIAFARGLEDTVTLLHGPFASAHYAQACGPLALAVDAATITPDCDAAPFFAAGVYPIRLAAGATELTDLEISGVRLRLFSAAAYASASGEDFQDELGGLAARFALADA
jgi:hypothetical protein